MSGFRNSSSASNGGPSFDVSDAEEDLSRGYPRGKRNSRVRMEPSSVPGASKQLESGSLSDKNEKTEGASVLYTMSKYYKDRRIVAEQIRFVNS